jgi:hypothetical protein
MACMQKSANRMMMERDREVHGREQEGEYRGIGIQLEEMPFSPIIQKILKII